MNGYKVASIPWTYVPPGWSEWYALVPPRYYDYTMNANGVLRRYFSAPTDYITDVLSATAVDLINLQGSTDNPFFRLVVPNAPHTSRGIEPASSAPRHIGAFAHLRGPNHGPA